MVFSLYVNNDMASDSSTFLYGTEWHALKSMELSPTGRLLSSFLISKKIRGLFLPLESLWITTIHNYKLVCNPGVIVTSRVETSTGKVIGGESRLHHIPIEKRFHRPILSTSFNRFKLHRSQSQWPSAPSSRNVRWTSDHHRSPWLYKVTSLR